MPKMTVTKAWLAAPVMALGLIAAKPAPGRAGANATDDRPRGGRGRPGQPLDDRAVDRWPGRRPIASRHRPQPRPAHPAADRTGFLQRARVPPRHSRLHGAGRRSARDGAGWVAAARPDGGVQRPAARARGGVDGPFRSPPTAPTASSSSSSRPTFKLNHKYSAFGRVVDGMAAVDGIAVGEPPAAPTTIVRASIGGAVRAASPPTAPAAPPPAAPPPGAAPVQP